MLLYYERAKARVAFYPGRVRAVRARAFDGNERHDGVVPFFAAPPVYSRKVALGEV